MQIKFLYRCLALLVLAASSKDSHGFTLNQHDEIFPRSPPLAEIQKSNSAGAIKGGVREPAHPCASTVKNHTVTTKDGKKIQCVVPDEKTLLNKLERIGGYNRHYVAVTLEEAEKYFDDLVNGGAITDQTLEENRISSREWDVIKQTVNFSGGTTSSRRKRQVAVACRSMTTVRGTHLCPACQHVTKLDDNMFPRYINELSCDGSPAFYANTIQCLGNMGKCYQNSMNVDLLTRTDNYISQGGNMYLQEWLPKVQRINTCCECVLST
ncbi:uncharacterized protein LOC5512281 isoform X2 [Nematostella vectensis]|nr:uncharacterized protein LOC5512281 isoform X2 [Nematostella vectensis]XP_032237639.1 uncharacterized protein LOC5512281 isoform X2 [Nematostella vectensis]XP_048586237.1 uncharacterized protein LOC5512281 isoform X2 [Nematostella vectensis]